ncbi:putative sulfate transport protein CysZ [Actinoalloteichus hoggarensis]|uniref:Putative sulfate transport protein CysZ n=2 Tax=Actinoalloteichus hoggarensis TaxID=1470176 RepID=A0A221VWH1_9PSEU|nr:putative sulfate transport protein CysZ [Actinoalloteichus hoggarensis]
MRDAFTGLGIAGRGYALLFSSRRHLLRGAVPALLTSLLYLGLLITLVVFSGDITAWLTPFADGWAEPLRSLTRITVGIVFFAAVIAAGQAVFLTVTLLVGGPVYESISEEIDEQLGGGVVEEAQTGWFRSVLAGLGDAVRMLFRSLIWAVVLMALGFIPILGLLVPLLAILVGSWLLALEITSLPMGRRGIGLVDCRRRLRRRRMLALGFALPNYLLMLVPFAALIATPAALAGGTVLARTLLDEETAAA